MQAAHQIRQGGEDEQLMLGLTLTQQTCGAAHISIRDAEMLLAQVVSAKKK